MTDKDKIEELLKNYRSLKSNIEIEITKKCPEYSLPSTSFANVSEKEMNKIYSDVEDYVVKKVGISEELGKKIKVRNIIKAAKDSLSTELQRIVEHYYFDDKSVKIVAGRLGWSEDTIRRRREDILKGLQKAGILEAWELWKEVKV